MTLFALILIEALVLLVLVAWVAILALRSAGRLGPRRGGWSRRRGTDPLPTFDEHSGGRAS